MADARVVIAVDGETSGVKNALDDVDRAAKRTAANMEREFKDRGQKIRQGIGAVFGGVVNDIDDVVGAVGALGPAGIAAAGALGAAGLAGALYQAAAATGQLEDAQAGLQDAIRDAAYTAGNAFLPEIESVMGSLEDVARAAQLFTLSLVTIKNVGGAVLKEFSEQAGLRLQMVEQILSGDIAGAIATAKSEQATIDYGAAVDEAMEATKKWWQETEKLNETTDRSDRGVENRKKLIHDLAEAEKEAAARTKERAAEALKAANATEELRAVEAEARGSAQAEWEIVAALDAKIDKINELYLVSGDLAAANEAQFAVEEEARRALIALSEDQREAHEETMRQIAAENDARNRAIESWVSGTANAAADLAQTVADNAMNWAEVQGTAARRVIEANWQAAAIIEAAAGQGADAQAAAAERAAAVQEDALKGTTDAAATAAMAAYAVSQASALAQAAINAVLLGSSLAVALVPVSGPAAPFIAAAMAATQFALNAAAIAAVPPPEVAHVGAMVGEPGPLAPNAPMAPDEVAIRATRGEEIVARGQQGRSDAPTPILIRTNHQYFDATESDRARMPNNPYRRMTQAIANRIPGHKL